MSKYIQAIGIWFLIIPLAIMNGGLRENILVKLGDIALPLSGIILSICIFVVAYLLIPKIKNELMFLAQKSAAHRAGEIVWDEAFIGLKDAIIAPLNQERGWQGHALNLVKLDAAHYSAQFFKDKLS